MARMTELIRMLGEGHDDSRKKAMEQALIKKNKGG